MTWRAREGHQHSAFHGADQTPRAAAAFGFTLKWRRSPIDGFQHPPGRAGGRDDTHVAGAAVRANLAVVEASQRPGQLAGGAGDEPATADGRHDHRANGRIGQIRCEVDRRGRDDSKQDVHPGRDQLVRERDEPVSPGRLPQDGKYLRLGVGHRPELDRVHPAPTLGVLRPIAQAHGAVGGRTRRRCAGDRGRIGALLQTRPPRHGAHPDDILHALSQFRVVRGFESGLVEEFADHDLDDLAGAELETLHPGRNVERGYAGEVRATDRRSRDRPASQREVLVGGQPLDDETRRSTTRPGLHQKRD
jgi:hypothetical protein